MAMPGYFDDFGVMDANSPFERYLEEEERKRKELLLRMQEEQARREGMSRAMATRTTSNGRLNDRPLPAFFDSITNPSATSTMNGDEAMAAKRASMGAMAQPFLRFVSNGGWYGSTIADALAARDQTLGGAEAEAQKRRDLEYGRATDEADRTYRMASDSYNRDYQATGRRREWGIQDKELEREETSREGKARAVGAMYRSITNGSYPVEYKEIADRAMELEPEEAYRVMSSLMERRVERGERLADREWNSRDEIARMMALEKVRSERPRTEPTISRADYSFTEKRLATAAGIDLEDATPEQQLDIAEAMSMLSTLPPDQAERVRVAVEVMVRKEGISPRAAVERAMRLLSQGR